MDENSVRKLGFWSAFVAFVAAIGYSVAQILQVAGVVGPPWDGVLIYGFSLFIATPFMLALLALHYVTPEEKDGNFICSSIVCKTGAAEVAQAVFPG